MFWLKRCVFIFSLILFISAKSYSDDDGCGTIYPINSDEFNTWCVVPIGGECNNQLNHPCISGSECIDNVCTTSSSSSSSSGTSSSSSSGTGQQTYYKLTINIVGNGTVEPTNYVDNSFCDAPLPIDDGSNNNGDNDWHGYMPDPPPYESCHFSIESRGSSDNCQVCQESMGIAPEWCRDCGTAPRCAEYQGWCDERDGADNGFCNSALKCFMGICVKTCATNSDCTGGIGTECVDGYCLRPCNSHNDCLHLRDTHTLRCTKKGINKGYCTQYDMNP